MEGSDVGDAVPPTQREMEVVYVEVDEVEFGRALEDALQHDYLVGQVVNALFVEAQGGRAARHKPGFGDRVAAGEQGYVVSLVHKLFGKVRYDALRAAVQ